MALPARAGGKGSKPGSCADTRSTVASAPAAKISRCWSERREGGRRGSGGYAAPTTTLERRALTFGGKGRTQRRYLQVVLARPAVTPPERGVRVGRSGLLPLTLLVRGGEIEQLRRPLLHAVGSINTAA